jgi:hypothetical protein
MSDLTRLSRAELERMAACGREALACQRLLGASGDSVVAEALRGAGPFYEWHHYPAQDVYDPATHAQFFYHAHPAGERPGEHGHFHTFLRERGMPPGVRPLVLPELAIADAPAAPAVPSAPQPNPGEDEDGWCHLVAIAMDAQGRAVRLFTTNRWVTGETWYTAADVAAMLDRFAVGGEAALNRWITAVFGLFRPQRGKVHVFEDRRLEVTSSVEIDVEAQQLLVEAALRRVGEDELVR